MLRSLDILRPLKWANIVAVTLVPAVSFLWFWGDFDAPRPMRAVATTQSGVLSHAAAARLDADEETLWCLRPCPDCGAAIVRAELAYGGDSAPPGWIELTQDAHDLCAVMSRPQRADTRVWLRTMARGRTELRGWPLPD